MAFLRWAGSMLLASLIILHWATSSAMSHDLTKPSALGRVKRDLPPDTKDKVDKTMAATNEALSVFSKAMEVIDKDNLSKWIKCVADIASIAPGVGSAVSAVVNLIFAFIPEDNEVLDAVKKGFDEVNQKLDSLSIQMTNLATDVEWNAYASAYSKDERCIQETWKYLNRFLEKRGSNDFKSLANEFVRYYKQERTETCVANFYHYLTVKDTALSKNINDILIKKFQCSAEIGKYNFHFTSLLWKGIVLNNVYWKIKKINKDGKDAEHARMFQEVFEYQLDVLQVCETRYIDYAVNTVKEMAKSLSADNQEEFAKRVKQTLDAKYSWYNWVVLVYKTKDEDNGNILVSDVLKIPINGLTVALEHTQKEIHSHKYKIDGFSRCLKDDVQCISPCRTLQDYTINSITNYFAGTAKVPYATYRDSKVAVAPPPSYEKTCMLVYKTSNYNYKLSFYMSENLNPCKRNRCHNNGKCRVLLKSNDWLCVCPTGYSGVNCEKHLKTKLTEEVQTLFPPPVIPSTKKKSKLNKISTSHRN